MAEFVVRLEDDWQAPLSYKEGDPIKVRPNGWHKGVEVSDACFVVQFPTLSVKKARVYIRRFAVAGDKRYQRLFYFPNLKPKKKKKFIRKIRLSKHIRSR